MTERCGSLTVFEPEMFYLGSRPHFTMSQLRDGRYFVPDAWMTRYPEIDYIVRTHNFHHDAKLDGWVEGPVLH